MNKRVSCTGKMQKVGRLACLLSLPKGEKRFPTGCVVPLVRLSLLHGIVTSSTTRVLYDASRRRFPWGMEMPCHGSLLQSGEGVR